MTKVSTNAGKHPYLRSDFIPPVEIHYKGTGIEFDPKILPKFKSIIDTEYKDKKGRKLFFKDIVVYITEKEEYEIGYDGRVFCWILINQKNPKRTLKLKEFHNSILLFEKYNKKQ